jgi:poly(3-hydroxybutyrate) depolymerase
MRSNMDIEGVQQAIEYGDLALPEVLAGGSVYVGKPSAAPRPRPSRPVPAVVFLHGSGGLTDATREWQTWLARSLHLTSFAPDSFATPSRIRYVSPVDKRIYEQVHALRAAELCAGIAWLSRQHWVDRRRLVVAGTSEGAVAVARMAPGTAIARILYAWSCESNYFVQEHGTRIGPQEPVLNIMSTDDPYFGPSNPWHGDIGDQLEGHGAAVMRGNLNSQVILLAGVPHTLYNIPAARRATQSFLEAVLRE